MTGSIPDEWANGFDSVAAWPPAAMLDIDMSSNDLQGSIPSSLEGSGMQLLDAYSLRLMISNDSICGVLHQHVQHKHSRVSASPRGSARQCKLTWQCLLTAAVSRIESLGLYAVGSYMTASDADAGYDKAALAAACVACKYNVHNLYNVHVFVQACSRVHTNACTYTAIAPELVPCR